MERWGPHGRWSMDTARAKFLAKIRKTESCWLWIGAVSSHGYGSSAFRGKAWMAHRLSYLLHKNEDPGKKEVMHKCDVKLCVNPDHLSLGTHADNMRDMENKGRSYHKIGESHGRATLTEKQAQEILDTYHSQEIGTRTLAKQFGASRSTVRYLVLGKTWKHLHQTKSSSTE